MANCAPGSRLVLALVALLPLGCTTSGPSEPEAAATEPGSPPSPAAPVAASAVTEPVAGSAATEGGREAPQSEYRVTARRQAGTAGPGLFMELYRGPEPGEWIATSAADGGLPSVVSIALPEQGSENWLIRVDSRPPGKGPYSISLHRMDREPDPLLGAPPADSYEGDDSWFQGTPLVLGEAQAHSLGDSANPRGDEDWFVVSPDFAKTKPRGR